MYKPRPFSELQSLFSYFSKCRIGVMGDFCIDAYWTLDTGEREISIETHKPTYAVRQQQYSLGGAGNIISNLKTLGVEHIFCIGLIGDDIFGREMRDQLAKLQVDYTMLISQSAGWQTPVYGKPYWGEEELDRLDFGRFNKISEESEQKMIAALHRVIQDLDILILNHQLPQSIYTQPIWDALLKIAAQGNPCKIIIDFRQLPQHISGMWVKLNAREAAHYCGKDEEASIQLAHCKAFAKEIHQTSQRPVIITRGESGMLAYDGQQFSSVPGIHITNPTDIVGAGDTTLATLASAIGAGASMMDAIELANYAAGVTIQKLQQTGNATPKEIRSLAMEAQFAHSPEVANDIRKATYWNGSDIEIVNPDIEWGNIKWAVFDHDGTISVLREGWEPIMEDMMLKSILGDQYDSISPSKLKPIQQQVQQYILHSAGMQTVDQMRWLAGQARDYGFVNPDQILTGEAYKDVFLKDLLAHTKERTDRVQNGELSVEDVTMKHAVPCLQAFEDRGIELVLLSGTDHEYVVQEAELLGYAHFFKGRIFGALANSNAHEKQQVMNKLVEDHNLESSQILALGDGPNEIRAIKRLGGIGIGIASDEVRRYGINLSKRERLIKAGADVIISDFSQLDILCRLIFQE